MSPLEHPDAPNDISKKRRATDVRVAYPRKRAVTACQLCRARKTKCDNQRPSCGTCLGLDIPCNYQDGTNTDLSSFDPASLAILDRINTAIQLLQNQAHLPSLVENLATLQHSLPRPLNTESPIAHSTSISHIASLPSDAFSPTYIPRGEESSTMLDDALQGPGNCHNILDWPIFGGKFTSDEVNAAFYSQEDDRQIREGANTAKKGIREEDAPMLLEYFLQYVHIKNPILDVSELPSMARTVAEEGFKWDGNSCLLLIICALANLAAPFSLARPGPNESSIEDAKDYPTAEAYYIAARKRTGLLGNSILAVQCMFLLGVYQMYTLRPLKAWMSFSQACAIFQINLQTTSRQRVDRAIKRLEQRLYWSCLKSECEMRVEIDLPPTGLAKVNHFDVFPSPPGGTPEPETDSDVNQSPRMHRQADFEKTWYYYLSEIACRRLSNRISSVLYSGSPSSWQLGSLPKLQRLAEELDNQVRRSIEHVPGFSSSMQEVAPDELTFMLQARYLELQELICRPFLYLVLHFRPSLEHTSTTLRYAERGLNLNIRFIQQCTRKHRHHGSWYGGRQCFTHALILLAAVRSGRTPVPDDWEATLKMALDFLSYFQEEAPDLGVARQLLVNIRNAFTERQEEF